MLGRFCKRRRKLPPLALILLERVYDILPQEASIILQEQVRAINSIHLHDSTLYLYRRRWGALSWEGVSLFPHQSLEHLLAELRFVQLDRAFIARMYLVKGHLFEIVIEPHKEDVFFVINVGIETVVVSKNLMDYSTVDTSTSFPVSPIPLCIQRILGLDFVPNIKYCFQPKEKSVIIGTLNSLFAIPPSWMKEFFACTNGIVFDLVTLYGIEELQKQYINGSEAIVIGESYVGVETGILFLYQDGKSTSIYWAAFDGTQSRKLGMDLPTTLKSLLIPTED